MDDPTRATPPQRRGRKPKSTPAKVRDVAMELFAERGFHETTVEQIARAAEIGRTTFFRYFQSKGDVIWLDFVENRRRLHAALDATDGDHPVMDGVRRAILDAFVYDAEDMHAVRQRWRLIKQTPELERDLQLHRNAWVELVGAFIAARIDTERAWSVPDAAARAAIGAMLSGMQRWVAQTRDAVVFTDYVNEALEPICEAFQEWLDSRAVAVPLEKPAAS